MSVDLLHHLLSRAADACPHRPAVVDGTRVLSYQELDEQSSRVAQVLIRSGVVRGDRVGLYLDKSVESVVALYGALKAGAAYVPLDPQAPPARLAYIARNCDIRCLLTGKGKAGVWDELVARSAPIETVMVLDAQRSELSAAHPSLTVVDRSEVQAQPCDTPFVRSISLDLAYILYTSGSTGDPKGVMLSHRNALAFVNWAREAFSITAEDRLSSHAPLHFDLSVFDMFVAAASAASVALVPSRVSLFPIEVARFIERHEITVWYSVPSVLTRLVQAANVSPGAFPHLRTVLFAGEVFPTKYLRRLMSLLPHVRFCNLYGPTETNVCTWYDVPQLPADQSEPISIGKAIADVDVFAVRDDGQRARQGEIGELFVRGLTVMQGYWADRERTARVLVSGPPDGEVFGPVYRTGDMVCEDVDGNYRFLGRRDAQVKSRGYRIELGEIETALYAHPAVVECAVLAVPDEVITNRLLACVVVNGDVDGPELAQWCAERIPRYMIPETFVYREALPKTSTGKVDRQTLARDDTVTALATRAN